MDREIKEVSVGEWIKILVILAIPIVNIVSLIYWAINKENHLKNYSRAILITASIAICFSIILGIFGGVLDTHSSPEVSSHTIPSSSSDHIDELDQAVKRDLEIVDLYIDYKYNYTLIDDGEVGTNTIIGKIKNNSATETYDYFDVKFNLYDEENSIIKTLAHSIFDELPPGETLKFSKELTTTLDYKYYAPGYNVKFVEIKYGGKY